MLRMSHTGTCVYTHAPCSKSSLLHFSDINCVLCYCETNDRTLTSASMDSSYHSFHARGCECDQPGPMLRTSIEAGFLPALELFLQAHVVIGDSWLLVGQVFPFSCWFSAEGHSQSLEATLHFFAMWLFVTTWQLTSSSSAGEIFTLHYQDGPIQCITVKATTCHLCHTIGPNQESTSPATFVIVSCLRASHQSIHTQEEDVRKGDDSLGIMLEFCSTSQVTKQTFRSGANKCPLFFLLKLMGD